MARAARKNKRLQPPTLTLPQIFGARLWSFAGLFIVLVIAILSSALAVVQNADNTRKLYQQLGETQQQQDALLAEHSRLLLERAALSSLQNIEQVAQTELDMEFPEQIGEVLR